MTRRILGPVIAFSFLSGLPVLAQDAPVITDGQTNTTVQTDAGGHITIGIAGADSDGISYNGFERFNVPEPGVDFDNRTAGARTIIAEVTGSDRSLINGSVEILGQRAHLFLANRNGISINGANFVNTGGLVLTTGAIDFVERIPAPGRTQNNTTIDVTQGEIIVGEDGMSGAMDTLHFLSKSIRIDGQVTNENTSAFASVELTAGDSLSEFDSSQLPLNDLSQWATVTPGENSSDQAYLIEVTYTGGIRGSRISALVTDVGAGVRHAGDILADRQDFTLTSDGTVLIDGGDIRTATGIYLEGREVLTTGAIGFPAFENDPIPETGIVENFRDDGFLIADEFQLVDELIEFNPVPDPEIDEDNSRSPDPRAELIAVAGPVELVATQGSVEIDNTLISAGTTINIDTPQDLTIDSSEVFTGEAISIETESITITSDDARSFIASNEEINLNATIGDVLISGARLQGFGTDEITGVTINSAGDIRIVTIDADNLGVIFGAEGGVILNAEADIINHTGRIIANGSIDIQAGGDFQNIMDLPLGRKEPLTFIEEDKGERIWFTGFLKRNSFRHYIMEFGNLVIDNEIPFVTATENIDIHVGGDIINLGGQINANNGEINLTAANLFNEAVVTGNFSYRRRCSIVCRSDGQSSLDIFGGQINAGEGLFIDVGNGKIRNIGGNFTGLDGIELTAREVIFQSLYLPQLIDRPSGLYNFWTGHAAWVYWRDLLGTVFTDENNIVINGAESIILRGVELENLISDIDPTVEYEPRQSRTPFDQQIGLLSDLEPVVGD